jgi:apolipoprotein N-acyltransferase
MKKIINNKSLSSLVALMAGASVSIGFAPLGLFPLPLLAMAVWMWLLQGTKQATAVWYGWLFGLGLFGAGIYWIYISIYLYGNAGLPLALLVTFLFVAFLALFPALAAWLSARYQTRHQGVNFLLLFPAVWILIEWLRSWIFTGFPWLNLGYSQIDSPLSAIAPVAGVYGVGWVLLVCAGLLGLVMKTGGVMRALPVSGLVLVITGTWGLKQVEWTQPLDAEIPATIIQGNISQDLKWLPEQQQSTLQHYLDLTAEHTSSKIIVWPETAIPAYYDQVEESFIEPLREGLAKKDIALITGIPVLDRDNWKYYNSIISLDDKDQYYYKVHLVPFGEYLPLRHLLATVLGFLPIPEADFSAGDIDQPLLTAAGFPFGASICYEIAFGEQLIKALPEARFLVNISNDAWFGDSLAPHQHLEMARMRALEVGRYLLRSTNTGISAVIDPYGKLVATTQQFEAATLTETIIPRDGLTPYAKAGNSPVIIGCLFLVLCTVWRRKSS